MKYNIETQIKSYVIESLFPFSLKFDLNRWHETSREFNDVSTCDSVLALIKDIPQNIKEMKTEVKTDIPKPTDVIRAKEGIKMFIGLIKAYKAYLKDNPTGKIKLSFIQ